MAAKKKGLGRGLDALIQPSNQPRRDTGAEATDATSKSKVPASPPPESDSQEVAIHLITPNPYQPREHFSETALEELAASIKEMGVLSPLLVRQRKEEGSGYQLIAGERRFRAAQRVGLKKIPVLIRDLSDQEALEIALVENLQRKDLNAIEEAEGYHQLTEEFGLTQDAVAKRVGKARASVANAMRLLDLHPEVRDWVAEGLLTAGHAKALLSLSIQEEQVQVARDAVREKWSVRETERRVKQRLSPAPSSKSSAASSSDIPPDHLHYLTEKLHQKFATGVRLIPSRSLANGKKVKGKLEIDFYSNEDLDRVLELFGLTEDL